MKVRVKILMNAQAVNDTKSRNQHYATERNRNLQRAKKDKVIVPADVDVPEDIIKWKEVLVDVKDIMRARIDEVGMITSLHLGETFQFEYTDEVWAQIEKRFNNE